MWVKTVALSIPSTGGVPFKFVTAVILNDLAVAKLGGGPETFCFFGSFDVSSSALRRFFFFFSTVSAMFVTDRGPGTSIVGKLGYIFFSGGELWSLPYFFVFGGWRGRVVQPIIVQSIPPHAASLPDITGGLKENVRTSSKTTMKEQLDVIKRR